MKKMMSIMIAMAAIIELAVDPIAVVVLLIDSFALT